MEQADSRYRKELDGVETITTGLSNIAFQHNPSVFVLAGIKPDLCLCSTDLYTSLPIALKPCVSFKVLPQFLKS